MTERHTDWDPGTYRRFRGLRLRPALDLLLQIGDPPEGTVVDLGCGEGAVAGPLRARFPGRNILGVDSSPAMLAHAHGYDATRLCDIAHWQPDAAPAVIFSNAALHWLPHHEALFPRLVADLTDGGVLAVQMPRQFHAPSHRLLRDLAQEMFPDRFLFDDWIAPVAPPGAYGRLLAPLGEVDLWETEYLQTLAPVAEGHPVRAFTQSTALRPFAARMGDGELHEFLEAYDEALTIAYPAEADGTVLFPFRRLFLVLTKEGPA
ncbi:methyltransferase domain-containing protein [Rubellimicrobium roseum]|uniref:Methyltransferase domain-containing protein n=1 Tax=Rubellimicrobium roseum TaxID=687525 RepID=A0A5C4NFL4_9RHOB|nr:methyltransferase domain-containing protein [Rubellimicrobium roseum]TNC70920.1 methyltransferase domain-containing protein [Rubellimicrobium roseum]